MWAILFRKWDTVRKTYDPIFRQRVPSGRAGFRALPDILLYLLVLERRALEAHHSEDLVQLAQQRQRRSRIVSLQLPLVRDDVELPHQGEDRRQGFGDVEVVVHRLDKTLSRLLHRFGSVRI